MLCMYTHALASDLDKLLMCDLSWGDPVAVPLTGCSNPETCSCFLQDIYVHNNHYFALMAQTMEMQSESW